MWGPISGGLASALLAMPFLLPTLQWAHSQAILRCLDLLRSARGNWGKTLRGLWVSRSYPLVSRSWAILRGQMGNWTPRPLMLCRTLPQAGLGIWAQIGEVG